jgi:hypothetical protein
MRSRHSNTEKNPSTHQGAQTGDKESNGGIRLGAKASGLNFQKKERKEHLSYSDLKTGTELN